MKAHPRRDEALRRLRDNEPAKAIAAELGVSVRTVEGWARALGRSPGARVGIGDRPARYAPRTQPTAPHRDGRTREILEAIGRGLSDRQIAKAIGVTRQTVNRVRRRYAATADQEKNNVAEK